MLQEQEFRLLIGTSQETSTPRLAKELVSLWAETAEGVDIYEMIFDESLQRLIDKDDQKPIEDYIDKNSSPLAQREYQSFLKMENLVAKEKESIIVWLSPPHEDRSADTKLTLWVTSLENNQKTTTGRTFLMNLDKKGAIEAANKLTFYSSFPLVTFSDSEILRESVFLFSSPNHWIEKLESVFGKRPEIVKIGSGQDLVDYKKKLSEAKAFGDMILAGVSDYIVYGQMVRSGFIGGKDISCPPGLSSTSQFLIQKSYGKEGNFVKNCGKCGRKINGWIPAGYECPSCRGIYLGC